MLHTLGGLHLEGAARQQAGPLVLLSYLALEGPQERRSVQELFFPGHEDAAGRLRMILHRLKLADAGALQLDGTRLQTTVPSDAAELLWAAERQEAAQVLALYRGRFLDGVRLPGHQDLEEWVFATRERLAARVRACHLMLAQAAVQGRDVGLALTHAERAYLLPGAPEPSPDEARLLALLLTASGSAFAADARTEAQGVQGHGVQGHGVQGHGVQRNSAQGNSAQGSGAPAAPGAAGLPTEASRAVAVLLGPSAPAPPAAAEPLTEPTLPTLLGREDALAQLEDCFAAGARLVTVLGPGGIGKTLLARHALNRLVHAAPGAPPSGVLPGVMVDLSSVTDASAVLSVIAGAVQAKTAHPDDVAQALRGHGLLLLDNFEQVMPAAPELAGLLEGAPGARLLVTSRERLHLSQEHVLPLGGLALGAQDAATPAAGDPPPWSDAARLFVRRATRAHLGFVPDQHREGIEQLCALLRGVPLLIELASAWVRTLSPAEIAQGLGGSRLFGADLTSPDLDLLEAQDRNVPARHASARTVLEASWRRLGVQEQQQLSRLAVFLSDFTVHAARQVTGTTLSVLANLTDKSWLGTAATPAGRGGRLSWHPLARAFVREASEALSDGSWRDMLPAHAQYFAQGLTTSRFQAESLQDLLGEWPDIGQSIRTLARLPADWPTLTRLAREVPIWADQVGNYASVAGLIGRVLDSLPVDEAPEQDTPAQKLRAQLLRARAFMFMRMHRLTEAGADYRAAADLLMRSGDEDEVLQGLDALAVLHHQAGEYPQAQNLWGDILRRTEELNLIRRQAYTLQYLAVNAWVAGELTQAEHWIREAIQVERRLPPSVNLILAYSTLGRTLTRLERRAEAQVALLDGLKLARQLRALSEVPKLLNFLALNLLELGRPEEAVKLCLEALNADQMAQPLLRSDMLDTLALCYHRTGQQAKAREALTQSTALAVQIQDVPDLLHRIGTFLVIEKATLTPPEHAAVVHWLLHHEHVNASLQEVALKLLDDTVQPARRLPDLGSDVISLDAQRLCAYRPGSEALLSFG